jgi:hypothetical protein
MEILKLISKKMMLWFKLRIDYAKLYDAIMINIRERTDDSEFVYRYFRYHYNRTKREYQSIKIKR